MRPDIVALLRSSRNAFVSGMTGIDPVAVFRWAVLRAFFRAVVAFREEDLLHQEVLRRIILLQRWFRVLISRQQFLHLRQASVIIQVG